MVQYNRMTMDKAIFGIFLFLFAMNTSGQTISLSREEMMQDIDTLFSTIEKVHPDMYAVYPREQLEQEIEKVKSELKSSGDIFYFYKQITPLVVKLGDGHTFVSFPLDSLKNVPDILLFPFSVKVSYPDMVIHVQNDYTPTQNTIPVGAQITSINNRKSDSIVQEMINYVSSEKDFSKIERLEYRFNYLIYTLYGDSIFDIEYQYNQKKYSVHVNGISYEEIYERPQQNTVSSNEQYTFRTLPDKNIGIIEFEDFLDLDGSIIFLNNVFKVLQETNIENLIIDIRKNGGGNSAVGDELLQYISPVPFAQFSGATIKYSDIVKQYFKGRWEISNPNGIEIQKQNPELFDLRENNLRYKGNVFLLISHYTFSSAANFSWAFKYFKIGTVIGEETGGIAVCFGNAITLKLPNSGLSYGIPWMKFYNYGATDENTHGTLPDYNIEAEKALDFTIDLITRKK